MKVALGRFARTGIEANLGPDVPAGIQAALADYVRRIESGACPIGLPGFGAEGGGPDSAVCFDLLVDARTLSVLEREAARQGATVSQIAAHAVLLYLAELDRLSPPGIGRAA